MIDGQVAGSSALARLSAEELAVRAQGGDEACFHEIVMRHRPALVAFLARRAGAVSDAEDLAQETFVRAHRFLDHYEPGRRFRTWLFAIGKHVASNHARTEARRSAREHTAAAAEDAPPRSEAADAGAALWRRARDVLSREAYRALWLRYHEDYNVREIAAELGRSAVSVKVMLFRARRKLLEEEP